MNKEELIKEYDEKAKALRDEFISKLEDGKKEFKLTYPENGETVYYIDDEGKIYDTDYFDVSSYDKYMFEHGLYFDTREEAEQHLKKQRLLFKLKKWAEIHNEGWQPNWSDYSTDKFSIYYDGQEEVLQTHFWRVSNILSTLPIFKTQEIAQACIDEFGEEIKEVLC